MANRVMGYVICGYSSVDNLMSEQSSAFRRWTTGSGAGGSYRHHEHNMYTKQMSEGAAPVGATASATGSNVARWSLGLEHLLADPAGAAAFAHFLAKEFAAENIRFWWSCEQYASTMDTARRAALATEIWDRHLGDKASEPVNVDAAARRAAELLLTQSPPPTDLFQQAQKQIFNVMKFDSYPRFLRSGVHAECARADLRGQPPPYAPRTQPINEPDSAKLKKSASNASERRRSGGTSLLPWKSRSGGRERTNSAHNEQPPLTDVVKSSQSILGQSTLCRVVLPDGSTSVVGVDPNLTVGRLVDKLLQRRNLRCNTYDVIIKENGQGSSPPVETTCPSTVLGGRDAVVERRCVVRVEVGGRAVAVRCRAGRRLRHVLRPVLARYAAGTTERAVLRDGAVVHPDTLMEELDGARLQIVDVSEGGDLRECRSERDEDADSLSELAVRVQDDICRDADSQSSAASSSSRGASSAGGRVRAALRPGPPLHHHPPDFLENLRETQRQRLNSKAETSAPLSPSPRTPPPLPPKPTHRHAPTVV